jgi:hypothetical protein
MDNLRHGWFPIALLITRDDTQRFTRQPVRAFVTNELFVSAWYSDRLHQGHPRGMFRISGLLDLLDAGAQMLVEPLQLPLAECVEALEPTLTGAIDVAGLPVFPFLRKSFDH